MSYGIMCIRHSTSKFGYASAWAKENGKVLLFNSREAAVKEAEVWSSQALSRNLSYRAEEYQE